MQQNYGNRVSFMQNDHNVTVNFQFITLKEKLYHYICDENRRHPSYYIFILTAHLVKCLLLSYHSSIHKLSYRDIKNQN